MHTNHRRSRPRYRRLNDQNRGWEKRSNHHMYRQKVKETLCRFNPDATVFPILDEVWNPWWHSLD